MRRAVLEILALLCLPIATFSACAPPPVEPLAFDAQLWRDAAGKCDEGLRHRMIPTLPDDLLEKRWEESEVVAKLGEPDARLSAPGRDRYGKLTKLRKWWYCTGVAEGLYGPGDERLEVFFDEKGVLWWGVRASD